MSLDIGKDLAENLLSTVNKTSQFVVDQAPDVIQQIISWEFWSSLTGAVISGLLGGLLLIQFRRFWAWANPKDESKMSMDRYDARFFGSAFGFLPAAVLLIFIFLFEFLDVVKVSVAPKLFLIEFLSNLVRGNK